MCGRERGALKDTRTLSPSICTVGRERERERKREGCVRGVHQALNPETRKQKTQTPRTRARCLLRSAPFGVGRLRFSYCFGFWFLGFGFRVWVLGFCVLGFEFWVLVFGF